MSITIRDLLESRRELRDSPVRKWLEMMAREIEDAHKNHANSTCQCSHCKSSHWESLAQGIEFAVVEFRAAVGMEGEDE